MLASKARASRFGDEPNAGGGWALKIQEMFVHARIVGVLWVFISQESLNMDLEKGKVIVE